MKTITIIGGGLAGLTLGIGLRQQNVPVTIWERGHYPRHKVCGEFISGRGLQTLSRLGLTQHLITAGARAAENASFFSEGRRYTCQPLPAPALCLSRYKLDAVLHERFCQLGGSMLVNCRWRGLAEEGTVLATGRRRQAREEEWNWFGLKAHARNVKLSADLEVHLSTDSYVGLCRIGEDAVNVCGLFRRRRGESRMVPNALELLRGKTNSCLYRSLKLAQFDADSFCSVAGLSLRPARSLASKECRVGDAVTMIPPLTGNGMSMALESAEIAIAPLVEYAHGRLRWQQAQEVIAAAIDARFKRRLQSANWVHSAIFTPVLRSVLWAIVANNQKLWKQVFDITR